MKFLFVLLFVLLIPASVEAQPPEKGDRALSLFACMDKGAIKNLLANAMKGPSQFSRAFKMYVQLGKCMPFPGMREVHVEKKLIEGETSEGIVYAVELQSRNPEYKYYTLLMNTNPEQGA